MRQERITRRPAAARRARRHAELLAPANGGSPEPADASVLAAADELLTRIAATLRETATSDRAC